MEVAYILKIKRVVLVPLILPAVGNYCGGMIVRFGSQSRLGEGEKRRGAGPSNTRPPIHTPVLDMQLIENDGRHIIVVPRGRRTISASERNNSTTCTAYLWPHLQRP